MVSQTRSNTAELLFLSWESPWPALAGGSLRTLGLLKELSKAYDIHLVVLSQKPLSQEQESELKKYARSFLRIPRLDITLIDKLHILIQMFRYRMPYHCAVLHYSFNPAFEVLDLIRTFPGVVYASYGHWGTLVRGKSAPNWILDQHNADIQFWRVYANQASGLVRKIAALLNWRLAAAHFPLIYSSVARIVSVCEEDRRLTQVLAPNTPIDVIENGVDCSYYFPDRHTRTAPPRLLFTGTSAPRNVTALRGFVRKILPLIKKKVPDVELLVAGNFHPAVQREFKRYPGIHFTGWVDDIRPYFNDSDVYVAPFAETHGSKLKIAEAMAMAMPIVSTPQGIRGFALVNGESVMIAQDDQEFAEQVVALIKDPKRANRIGENAREVALATIDWPVLGKKLVRIVQETMVSLEIT